MDAPNDLRRPVKIRLAFGIHHEGTDYAPGDVLEVPAYQAIAYEQQGRGQILGEKPKVPPLTKGAVVQQDPKATHGDPGGGGTAPPNGEQDPQAPAKGGRGKAGKKG